jgi:hypothetical protein
MARGKRRTKPLRRKRTDHAPRRIRTGGMSRGLRFERLESRMLLAADFGDAPAPYPTLLAHNGPQHAAVGPQLGALRDTESDGVPSAAADGDGADDDGISFSVLRAGQFNATVTVTVANTTIPARLSGWIDFNGDGSWGGPGEQVFDGALVSPGTSTLLFDVPALAVNGTTFARFRLSTQIGLGVGGPASSGEVEDVAVTILPPHAGLGIFVAGGEVASPTSFSFRGMAPADIDGDGDLDFFGPSTGGFHWYENNGSESFTPRAISSTGSVTAIAATDLDGDGDVDAAYVVGNAIGWAENINGAFTLRTVDGSQTGPVSSIAAADIDKDGDIDLLATLPNHSIALYRNSGSQIFTSVIIATSVSGLTEITTADVDSDGDLDVLSASGFNDSISWYENNGAQTFTRRIVDDDLLHAYGVSTADIDRDGELDILGVSPLSGELVWYENDGAQNWTRRLVTTITTVIDVQPADIDGDGDVDLLAARSSGPIPLLWYANDGAGTFTEQVIATQTTGVIAAQVADVDGDGVLDLLAMSSSKVAWYRQEAVHDYGDAPAPYPTTLAENGARHYPTGPRLGATRDAEADGAHSADATGEGADDDGVVFGELRTGDLTAAAVVNVQEAPNGARVDVWIDFDGDGNWHGPGEHVADNVAVNEGDNAITFAVPSDAVAGATFARVRLSTGGRHGIGSAATDGEVEDYAVTIVATPGTGVFGPQRIMSSNATAAGAVVAADFDGDGDIDAAYASFTSGGLHWLRNTGAGAAFTSHAILTSTTMSRALAAADVDGDGDVDLIANPNGAIAWFENSGTGVFTQRVIASSVGVLSQLLPIDFEGDGDLDIVIPASLGMTVYVNNGAQSFTTASISLTGGSGTRSLALADLDGDGDLDVASTLSNSLSYVTWTELNGYQVVATRNLTASTAFSSALRMTTGDYDGDGDADLVVFSRTSSTSGHIHLYANNGDGTFTQSLITQADPDQLKTADVDGDGDEDILFSSLSENLVQWLENNGSGGFTERTISGVVTAPYGVDLADMDGDGDLDVLSASRNDNKVAWYEQLEIPIADYGDAPAPYAVTFHEGGATHLAVGPQLGATRTSGINGTHSPQAGGADDDDGVTLGAYRVGQNGATLTIDVQNAPAGARLDAWIDFNGNGSWSDPGEQIIFSRSVVQGANVISFNVPGTAVDGLAYARFRLSNSGKLQPGGAAVDGEVEDYAVTLSPPVISAGAFAGRGVAAGDALATAAGDFDGDGDLDLVASQRYSPYGLIWYANDGNQNFTYRATLGSEIPVRIVAFDVDGDGDLDLLTSGESSGARWYFNNAGVFTAGLIMPSGSRYATPIDMDRDGDIDVFLGTTWIENRGAQSPFYAIRTITQGSSTQSYAPVAADFDRDGDVDVMIPETSNVAYYENNGFQSFTRYAISTVFPQNYSPRGLHAVDWDGDGDLDVVGGYRSGTALAWFENTGTTQFAVQSIPYTGSLGGVQNEIVAADIDGDGDLDLSVSTSTFSGAATILRNLGNQSFAVDGAVPGNMPHFVDLDRDGDLDVVPTYRNSSYNGVIWAENVDNGVSMTLATPTAVAEESTDNLVFTFTRTGLLTSALTVNLTYVSTATPSVDYTVQGAASFEAGVATIVFPAGIATVQLVIDPIDDSLHERVESVYFTLQGGTRYAPLTTTPLRGDIVSGESDIDFGDAPLSYGTTLAQSAAYHFGNPGPRLGATIDFELDGAPSTNADGDGSDEDGVVIGPLRVGQRGATISVTVSNAAAGARLDAWIDFDGDGSWGGGDERIARSFELSEGVNLLTIDVPVDAAAGATYSRFRVSTAGGLGVTGSAPNGEVEDYLLTITPPLLATGLFSVQELVAGSAAGASQLISADLDSDGDLDLIAASPTGAAWYERGAAGAWTHHALPGDASGPSDSLAAADVDGDGDLDLFVGSRTGNWIGWLENDGDQQFTVHTIDAAAPGARSLNVADVNGDGLLDLVAVHSTDNFVARYRNNVSSGFSRSRTTFTGANSVVLGDVDRDGDVDALAYSSTSNSLMWLYNFSGSFDDESENVATGAIGESVLAVADVNGDGQLDVISGSTTTGKISWYDRSANTVNLIGTMANGISSIAVADVTGDGKLDIVAAGRDPSAANAFAVDAFVQFPGLQFERSPNPFRIDGATSVTVADFDGDGDLDFAAGGGPQDPSGFPYGIQILNNADSAAYIVLEQDTLSEEGGVSASVEFKRRGRLDAALTFEFLLLGTAERNVDYSLAGAEISGLFGEVTFAPGADSWIVTVTPIDDAAFELDENVHFTVFTHGGHSSASPSSATLTLTSAELAGDYDGDSFVTGNDFLAWQRQLGAIGLTAGNGADGSRDGTVDADDLDVWRANFPAAAVAAAVTAAPEGDSPSPTTAEASDVAIAAIAESTSAEKEARSTARQSALQRTAALDALYAAGDFSSLLTGRQTFRPIGRPRLRPARR